MNLYTIPLSMKWLMTGEVVAIATMDEHTVDYGACGSEYIYPPLKATKRLTDAARDTLHANQYEYDRHRHAWTTKQKG